MLEADNQQQQQTQQEEEAKVPTLEEVREQKKQEQEEKEQQQFIANLEGKTSKELSLKELSYLYKEHRKTYDKITQDREAKVSNIEWLDKMAKQKKATEAKFEKQRLEAEQEAKANTSTEDSLTKMINEAINRSFKKFGL